MELVVPEVTRPSDLELSPVTAPVVVAADPATAEPSSAEPASTAPVVRQRRAHPERHVEVTELSPRAGAIVVAAEALARSGDTEAVIEVPSGMTEVIDRAAVEQAIARARAAAKEGEPLGPAIEVERETYAERDAARAAMLAAPPTLDRRGGGRGWRWVALLAVLSVGAALVLWWVDNTVRAGDSPRDELGGAETRPAAIAADEPELLGAGSDVGGPRLEAVDVKPEVAPPPVAWHPVPAPSVEDAAPDLPSKPPTKPATSARPKPVKPDAPVPSPSVPAVPIHETAACVEARAAVARAASSAAWADVLAHSKNRRCWSDASVVTRARVRALATLGRYDECVREGKGVTDPALAALIEVCRTRRGEP
jgi:hypothetical protein